MAFDKFKFAKRIIHSVVLIGASRIANEVIKNNTDPEGMVDKITIKAGRYGLSGVAAYKAAQYTDEKFDRWVERWQSVSPKEPVTLIDNRPVA